MIPVNTPLLGGNEIKYLNECINTGWISSEGPFVSKFENLFAEYNNRKFGVAVSNGSAALDIAIRSLGLGVGDEVIVPTFTIISPVQSIISSGARPVLVDCDENTWNLDVNQVESKINKNTKAILVVHIYGLPVDMNPILELCNRYGLFLIEDAAEMHGQYYFDRKCGSFGDLSIFSFYPNKLITTGEGGMIVMDNERLAEKCKKLRNLAFDPEKRRFVHEEIGWNYRMTNLQAALGLAQFERIDAHLKRKIEIGNLYHENLSFISDKFQLPVRFTEYSSNVYWVFALVANSEDLCKVVVNKLSEYQIGTRPFFWCMHEQPVFKKMGLFQNEKYPNAEKIARNGFYLPSGVGLSNDEVLKVCKIFKDIYNECI